MAEKSKTEKLEIRIRELTEEAGRYRQLAEKSLSLYEAMNEGVALHDIVYDEQGNAVDYILREINPAYEKITGINRNKAVGSKASVLYGVEDPPYLDIFARVAATGQAYSFETYFPPMAKHFSISVFSPDRGTFGTIFWDVTAQKEAIKKLEKSQKRYKHLFDNAIDMMHVVDCEGRIVKANPVELKTLGYTREEFVGRKLLDVIHPDCREKTTRAFAQLLEGKEVRGYETRLVAKDGRIIDVEVNATPEIDEDVVAVHAIVRDITQRKETTQALFDNEKMLQSIFRAAPIGIGMVSNRMLIMVNDKLEEMTGFTQEELLGRSARMLYPSAEEFEWVGREKYLQIEKNGTGTVETRWQRKDGEIIEVLLSSTPLDQADLSKGVTFTVLDITARKYSEQALEKSKELYRSLVENINLGITLIDKDHNIVMANRAQGFLLRQDPLSFVGKKCFRKFERREQVCSHCPGVEAMATATSQEIETEGFTDSGPVAVRIKAFPVIGQDGQVEGFIEVVEDITEQKWAREEKERMEKQLQHVQKLESLGVLAGGIAHDFNNLLMAILGNADLALMQLSSASPALDNIKEIEKASMRAADLCKQMLAYSGKGKFVVEPLNLSAIVEEITHMLQISISKKAVLKFNLAENLPDISADATQVRQIVMNLVINASEAIGEKSGVISLSTGVMDCDRDYLLGSYLDDELPEGLYGYIEVADTGCGMDEETLGKIFDPFFTTKFTGRGLGMAASLGIVRGHRGSIKIYTEAGRGTTFKVLFPASDLPVVHSLRIGEKAVPLWQGSGTVLLADDEDTVRTVGKRMLEVLGFEVLVAADGKKALEIFVENHAKIVCVVLDLTMPHLDGEETFREMRRIRKDVRVIISSGYNEQDVSQRFVGKKLAGFVQKPYQMKTLSTVMQAAFEKD